MEKIRNLRKICYWNFLEIILLIFLGILTSCFLVACNDRPLNSPHPLKDYGKNIRFGSFPNSPKSLDPAQSYNSDELTIISQIYEPPLQYHYLKRPYTLVPLTAVAMPVLRYWDNAGHELPANTPTTQIAFTSYDIQIQPGIFYQPHPAFAKDQNGHYRYLAITSAQLKSISQLKDFPYAGTRELVAADYVYEIKRLAHPGLSSPIFGTMQKYIVGLDEYSTQLREIYATEKAQGKTYLDLRQYPLAGAQVLSKYSYRITLKGQYSQFLYWLAMSFFAPIPWEADAFYSQPGMNARNLNFNWYPVGTGAYFLAENNPNRQMILQRNPNFHAEYYPTSDDPEDQSAGYLQDAGKRLPFVDQFIYSLEKEAIPRWSKFLQGYYDQSAISADNFGEAITTNHQGKPGLTPPLLEKNIRLITSVEPVVSYFGFNMLDHTVGGYTEKARKLRQAIAIALNMEELIDIFMNGRGIAAQGPIPPGIFGYIDGAAGVNPYVYDYVDGKLKRKSLALAKKLLAEAGYPNGRDAVTGKPLVLRYDTVSMTPTDKDQFDWMRKQFQRLGIELLVESTDYNRYLDKLSSGSVQIFPAAWQADYPDPENFLFLLYGPNGEVKYGGVNAVNYQNPEYDHLFEQMKTLPNNAERLQIIEQMQEIVRNDSPWIWGINPKQFMLAQKWLYPVKPNSMANNTFKYQRLNPQLRLESIKKWNQPILWPLLILVLVILGLIIPVWLSYWYKNRRPIKKYDF